MVGRVRMLVHPGCGQPSKVSKTVIPKVTDAMDRDDAVAVLSEQPVGDLADHVKVEDRSRREELLRIIVPAPKSRAAAPAACRCSRRCAMPRSE
jgi:hypothetical protein